MINPYLDDSTSNVGFAPRIFKCSRWCLQRGHINGVDVTTQGIMELIKLFLLLFSHKDLNMYQTCYISSHVENLCFIDESFYIMDDV